MKKVPKETVDLLHAYTTNPNVTFKEAVRHMYHWYMATRYIQRSTTYRIIGEHHMKQLNDDIAVLNLRVELKDV